MPEEARQSADPSAITPRQFGLMLVLVVVIAATVRGIFPTADPPWRTTVGVVWHDEGAWVHNARNRALWGVWSLDAWNPMYIAPVFTALEYVSFAFFGVGLWQARLVSEALGVTSVLLLALGVRRLAGDTAGIIAGALLATNYVYVMYNRAAIIETTMVACMVASWYCYVRAGDRPAWAAASGILALLAFFTKAAAAFFVAALALDAAISWLRSHDERSPGARRRATAVGVGLAGGGLVALAVFVGPNWADYRFYNWQMSVTRKPNYDLQSLVDRVSWFPILHDVFTRTWLVLVVATTAALAALTRWRQLPPPERLLLLWLGVGTIELLVHDVGNERRFVFFIPAVVALAALALGGRRAIAGVELAQVTRARAALALPAIAFGCYVMAGAIVRVIFLYEVRPNVRTGAAIAIVATGAICAFWPRLSAWMARERWTSRAALALAALVCAGDGVQFAQWAAGRTYENIAASIELGRRLPPDTLVHGKLANGLALENKIRPVFIGREFGNYDDRKHRDDVRYILTYISPSLGYESQARDPVIKDVLDAYPRHRIVMTFDVAETSGGHDRAALIDKFGGDPDRRADGTRRAHD
jgi:4-amino-4-deoxy-L-arabinose transferase-like glycosyltransferase